VRGKQALVILIPNSTNARPLGDINALTMRLEIELTRRDYLNYQRYYFMKRTFKQMLFYFILGIVFIESSINNQTQLGVPTAIIYANIYTAIFGVATYYTYVRPKKVWKKYFVGKLLYNSQTMAS
jgi:hypothetical protein